MGRTSRFHFPIPGRKQSSSKDKDLLPVNSPTVSTYGNLSKAQRFLGTDNELNIDSPTREDTESWRYPGSRSSGMSISISESTQSIHELQCGQWDDAFGVSPRTPRGKASSTLLGQHYGDDRATSTSSVSGGLRNEGSSSTLRSYYDRQKSPLAISQQTSNSSARDLALRKGFPPIVQRSPLLQVESVDPFEGQFSNKNLQVGRNEYAIVLPNKNSRKKPARLDLTMLFPSRKLGKKSDSDSVQTMSPSSIATNMAQESQPVQKSGRRKLTKVSSKESLQSQKYSIRSSRSQHLTTEEQLYDHYEHMPPRSARMDQIPESRILDPNETRAAKPDQHSPGVVSPRQVKNRESFFSPSNSESFSGKNARESMTPPAIDSSSAASFSSHRSRTSRHTSASVLSNSDLKQSSVLSLSSDEENSEPERLRSPGTRSQDNKALRVLHGSAPMAKESRRHPALRSEGLSSRSQARAKGTAKETRFLTIPESSIPTSPISGPWLSPNAEVSRSSSGQKKKSRLFSQKEIKSSKRPPSTASGSSSQIQQLTPPLSPTSVEFRQSSSRSSRFMAVTKQEEALLEALRQKRARMKEEIIEEHETKKSPPRVPERITSRYSTTSTVSTVRGNRANENQKVLLYLDTPISESQSIDTAEPSPDLSDFLSFGSDEDSTPRTSCAAPSKDQPRPDSAVSPVARGSKVSPKTRPSAARLSAVGATGGFRDERAIRQETGAKKRLTGVRFLDDPKLANAQDFLLDDGESEIIWGL